MFSIDALSGIFDTPEYQSAKVVMIEEGQFFTGLADIVKYMLDVDRKVIYVYALNGDSNRNVFGDISALLPLCHSIDFLPAFCIQCRDGTLGIYSKRVVDCPDQILIGSSEYQSVCLDHYLSNSYSKK
jgi:thymidine kinase